MHPGAGSPRSLAERDKRIKSAAVDIARLHNQQRALVQRGQGARVQAALRIGGDELDLRRADAQDSQGFADGGMRAAAHHHAQGGRAKQALLADMPAGSSAAARFCPPADRKAMPAMCR